MGIELAVARFSVWAPDMQSLDAWRDWAWSPLSSDDCKPAPDVGFVEPLIRRRLSVASKMALHVAWDCAAEYPLGHPSIFCSRYGEFSRSLELLRSMARSEPPSPMLFSQSVHNTAACLFSIALKDHAPSSALAAGSETLEAAFTEAWTMLQTGDAQMVLVVYFDEYLPRLYADQKTTVKHSAAFAVLLRRPEAQDSSPKLSLDWQPGGKQSLAAPKPMEDPALRVMRLVLVGGPSVTNHSDRLVWLWARDGAAT